MAFFRLFIAGILLCSLSGCVLEAEKDVLSKDVILDGAKEVQARIRMHKGELIMGGQNSVPSPELLLVAKYDFQVPTKRPQLLYDVKGTKGYLLLEQNSVPTIGTFPDEKNRLWNQWHLQWNKEIPLDLEIIFGEGRADLDMAHMTIKKLQLDSGMGDVALDLTQVKRAEVVVINSDKGALSLGLPKDKGVVISMLRSESKMKLKGFQKKKNLYYNGAYEEGQQYFHIDLRVGSGAVEVYQK